MVEQEEEPEVEFLEGDKQIYNDSFIYEAEIKDGDEEQIETAMVEELLGDQANMQFQENEEKIDEEIKSLLDSYPILKEYHSGWLNDLVENKKYKKMLDLIYEHKQNSKIKFPINEDNWNSFVNFLKNKNNHLVYSEKPKIFIDKVEDLLPYMNLYDKFSLMSKKEEDILNSSLSFLQLQAIIFNQSKDPNDSKEIFKNVAEKLLKNKVPKDFYRIPNLYYPVYSYIEDSKLVFTKKKPDHLTEKHSSYIANIRDLFECYLQRQGNILKNYS